MVYALSMRPTVRILATVVRILAPIAVEVLLTLAPGVLKSALVETRLFVLIGPYDVDVSTGEEQRRLGQVVSLSQNL
jgi:hypothetical protein